MTDKDFTMVMLDELEINLCGDGTLYVYDSHSSFHQRFEPGEQFYNEILEEYYLRNLRKHYELILDTACKMAVFFDIDMEEQKCIRNKEGAFMQLTDDEYKCFKDILGEAIDRGLGLMFNKLSE